MLAQDPRVLMMYSHRAKPGTWGTIDLDPCPVSSVKASTQFHTIRLLLVSVPVSVHCFIVLLDFTQRRGAAIVAVSGSDPHVLSATPASLFKRSGLFHAETGSNYCRDAWRWSSRAERHSCFTVLMLWFVSCTDRKQLLSQCLEVTLTCRVLFMLHC